MNYATDTDFIEVKLAHIQITVEAIRNTGALIKKKKKKTRKRFNIFKNSSIVVSSNYFIGKLLYL